VDPHGHLVRAASRLGVSIGSVSRRITGFPWTGMCFILLAGRNCKWHRQKR
jgi:hypothetical protein